LGSKWAVKIGIRNLVLKSGHARNQIIFSINVENTLITLWCGHEEFLKLAIRNWGYILDKNRPLSTAGSTDRCNTGVKSFCWCFKT
jgi:hypothetical protein